jgi:hypothetical protein
MRWNDALRLPKIQAIEFRIAAREGFRSLLRMKTWLLPFDVAVPFQEQVFQYEIQNPFRQNVGTTGCGSVKYALAHSLQEFLSFSLYCQSSFLQVLISSCLVSSDRNLCIIVLLIFRARYALDRHVKGFQAASAHW